jgi:hypothetical protein
MTRDMPAPGVAVLEPRSLAPPLTVSTAARRPRAGRRLMCVSHVMPYPTRAGNAYRIHRLLRWLADEGWDLTVVLCLAEAPSEQQLTALATVYPNLVVCTHGGHVWHHLEDGGAHLEALRGRTPVRVAEQLGEDGAARLSTGSLWLQRGFCPDVLVSLLRHLDRAIRPDVLLAEYVFMARAFPLLRPESLKVVDTIDVFSAKTDKVERYGVSDGYAMSESEEAALLRRADVLIGIQPDEAVTLARLSPDNVVVCAGIDVDVAEGPAEPPSCRRAVLVASDNPMNVHGVQEFLRAAWPLVRAAVPDAELRVIGAVGEAITAPPSGVTIVGRAERIEGEYRAARAAINPAIAGTGLKVKTIEALGHLRPIVTWPAGVDGLGPIGRRFCDVASSWTDFAHGLVRLLSTTSTLSAMAAHRDVLARTLAAGAVYGPLGRVLDQAVPAVTRSRHRPTGRPLRVLTLLARHGSEQYATAVADMRELFARQLVTVDHDIVVVDTALARGTSSGGDVELIGGCNSAWEFSAWDDAIAHVGARLDEYDFVHLATSAFRQLYVGHLGRFEEPMLRIVDGQAVAVGHIDHHAAPVTLFGFAAQAWLRSSFILVPPRVLRRLGTLVSVVDREGIFSGDPATPFLDDAPVSQQWRENVLAWLTGDGTGQGTVWHSRFELTKRTLRRFEDKAVAIINEQMLTNRLRAAGCGIIDAIWLATRARQGDATLDAIPAWPDQLMARDTDARIV